MDDSHRHIEMLYEKMSLQKPFLLFEIKLRYKTLANNRIIRIYVCGQLLSYVIPLHISKQ